MDEKINLLVCYFFNDTVYVDSLNPDPANAGRPGWLNAGPSGGDGERKVDTRGSEGRRRGAREPFHRLSGRIIGVLVKLR